MTTIQELRTLALEGDEQHKELVNAWLLEPMIQPMIKDDAIILGMLVRMEHFRQYAALLESDVKSWEDAFDALTEKLEAVEQIGIAVRDLKIDELGPIEAITKLYELKRMVK